MHLDTPGGSATACHNMACEIKELINASKPVIAVQSNVAASGGYYLSAPCSYIISSPSTITGSIGIIAMKFTTRNFWKGKLGINYDRVTTNKPAATQFSLLDGFGEYERLRTEQALTIWYKKFKGVISTPRDMTMDKVEKVAKGQVWLGSQALRHGLVDEIGGLYCGLSKIKELCNIPSYKNIKLVNPLGKMSLWDILIGTQPEHENDFSKPRTMMSALISFINPINYIKYSNLSNLLITNIISSPFISSVLFLRNEFMNKDNNVLLNGLNGLNGGGMNDMMGIMNFGGDGMRIYNDIKYVSNELKFYRNNSILMYSPYLSYFHHNMLRNGQI